VHILPKDHIEQMYHDSCYTERDTMCNQWVAGNLWLRSYENEENQKMWHNRCHLGLQFTQQTSIGQLMLITCLTLSSKNECTLDENQYPH